MLTDLYQLTMMYGYEKAGKSDDIVVFDLFFRKTSGDSAYAITAEFRTSNRIHRKLTFFRRGSCLFKGS